MIEESSQSVSINYRTTLKIRSATPAKAGVTLDIPIESGFYVLPRTCKSALYADRREAI